MKKPHVHLLYEYGEDQRPFGVAYIRVLRPLQHPHNASFIEVTHGREYAKADIVVVQRFWRPDVSLQMAEELVAQIRRDRGRLVYMIDDNLMDHEGFSVEKKMVARYLAREANGVIVSTQPLKERLSALNDTILVVPNHLDERLFGDVREDKEKTKQEAGRKILGFMGTYTHDADLMMVLQPLREVLRNHGEEIEFQLVGGLAHRAVIRAFKDLPHRVLEVEPKDVEYPSFVRWMIRNLKWDLAIAPLEDTSFNRYKSDIKFLDYSALGIATICSRVRAYDGSVRHQETGYLAENEPQAWYEGLEHMLQDDEARMEIASRAQEYVFSERTLQRRASEWWEAIETILDSSIR